MAKRNNTNRPAVDMFADCSDLPLFSGTPVVAQDSPYQPAPASQPASQPAWLPGFEPAPASRPAPASAGQLDPEMIAILQHQQAYYQRWGIARLTSWRTADGDHISSVAVYRLVKLGFFEVQHGGPGTYGHTDFYITESGLAMQV
jgi:hypothetical protein